MSVHRSFRLDETLDARLVAYAGELGRPVSWVIVQALRDRFGPVDESGPVRDRGSSGGFVRREHLPTCKCGVCKPLK